jgi:hypothetical protein
MAGIITLAADSTTLILNGTAITDLVEGDTIVLAPVNPSTSHVNAIGGGVNINERSDKGVYDVTINVQRFSESDVLLNSWNRQSPPELINGSAKEDYTRDGTDGVESWVLENGSITTQPTATKNSTDGNAESQYVIRFRNVSRDL